MPDPIPDAPTPSDDAMLAFFRRESFTPAMPLLGGEMLAIDSAARRCTVRFRPGPHLLNARGLVHGGQLCAMLDLTLSIAAVSATRFASGVLTVEMKTSFMRAAEGPELLGHGHVVHLTRSLAFLEGHLETAAGVLLATATATARLTASNLPQDLRAGTEAGA